MSDMICMTDMTFEEISIQQTATCVYQTWIVQPASMELRSSLSPGSVHPEISGILGGTFW